MTKDDAAEGLRYLAKLCWETSEKNGWHEETTRMRRALETARTGGASAHNDATQDLLSAWGAVRGHGVPVMSKLMLIATEVAEAAEVFRDAKAFSSIKGVYQNPGDGGPLCTYMDGWSTPLKPEGFGSELADIIIRVFDLAEELGIDLGAEVLRKMRYNATREYRHGGKAA